MWINSEVDIPEPLLAAQQDRRLVIFAGTGVSMGPTSNLPDFTTLATRVAGGALQKQSSEPLDHFLGRLEADGVDVQNRTHEIIGDPTSMPRRLHTDLLDLFPSPESVRIVTTNFDRHFTTIAQQRYGSTIEIHCGPALPLGRELQGIVFLHGSVDKPQHRLILTDGDFGRAYVTDARATRMLVQMFSHFCVLFVGYSHEDPIMGYLARGLVPGTERFALTIPGSDEKWRHFGIVPVHFPPRAGPDKFGALEEAIRAWSVRGRMGFLDHEQRIRQLAQSPPPLEREPGDYIASVLKDPVKLRFFTRSAGSLEWLDWAEDQGAFRRLFDPGEAIGEAEQLIATWFARNFVVEHPSEAIALVQRNGLTMHPLLWQEIGRRLAMGEPRPDPATLAAWVTILVSAEGQLGATGFLDHLLSSCRQPEEAPAAILLFGHLARPRLKLEKPWGPADETRRVWMHAEVELRGDLHELKLAWEDFFRLHFGDTADALVGTLTAPLTEAHFLLRATGEASERWDPLSFGRSAIEPHGQDQIPTSVNILVDAARDILEWLLETHPERGEALITQWSGSGVPLLIRLSIHGLAENPRLDPEMALKEIMERQWLYAPGLKHEVFRLIERTSPRAGEATRVEFIRFSMEAPTSLSGHEDEEAQATSDYERYNVAVWLQRVAPNCRQAQGHLAQLQARHPNFASREHPDLDRWMGEVRSYLCEVLTGKRRASGAFIAQLETYLGTNHSAASTGIAAPEEAL